MPLFELVVAPLVVHRLELLVIGDHRRPEAEAARERGHDEPPGRLLLVPFLLGNEIVGIDQFLHPLDDIGIGFLDALGSDVELEEAMHRRLARDEVEPMVTLGFLPPVKRRDDVDGCAPRKRQAIPRPSRGAIPQPVPVLLLRRQSDMSVFIKRNKLSQ